MQCLHKKKIIGKKSESGFVLIVALIGILILLAVGFYATTLATSELMIASRIAGERKAFSAAEAGVHALISSFRADLGTNDTGWTKVDSANDPNTEYQVTGSTELPGLSQSCTGAFSIEGGLSWHCKNYRSTVTGRDTAYKSTITIDVGIKGRAVPDTPSYDY